MPHNYLLVSRGYHKNAHSLKPSDYSAMLNSQTLMLTNSTWGKMLILEPDNRSKEQCKILSLQDVWSYHQGQETLTVSFNVLQLIWALPLWPCYQCSTLWAVYLMKSVLQDILFLNKIYSNVERRNIFSVFRLAPSSYCAKLIISKIQLLWLYVCQQKK